MGRNGGGYAMTDKEIMKALRCCRLGKPCTSCPAAGRGKGVCSFDEVHAGAVATIERLTAENAKAEAERDAALADLADARNCKNCKYACDTRDCSNCKSKTCKCRECHLDKNAWEWRGLPEAPEVDL